ncbi:alpha/beta hydrolase [Amycolatopsis sp. 195334CR]|uniref:alpha/beta hydrolase n=1 Tax=Amycolatopsis sp. 195334CR TaxID=2814588 RepID=UPI001A8DA2F1|nr:alpha/beta hydrolase [Amycolatopsis sp. 195334CR]MBN6034441.1 alpha/beta hydrolase [Amycolatopsis sp. 195334CR]
MTTVSEVKQWNAGALNEIGGTVRQREQVLVHSGDDFAKLHPVAGWGGPSADNALSAHGALMRQLKELVAGSSAVAKALLQAADAIPPVQRAIAAAEELGHRYGFGVDETGQVVDTGAPPGVHPEDRGRVRQQMADALAQALRTADDIDKDLASVLRRARHGEFATGDEATVAAAAAAGTADLGLTLPEPPENATPAQKAAWWSSLSPAGQAILLRDRPAALGRMDGLPADVRDRANRVVLAEQRGGLQRERDEVQRKLDGLQESDPREMDEFHELERRREELDGKLAGLDKVDQKLGSTEGADPSSRHYLLGIDGGGDGQAIVAKGNPDLAQHVATYVPGTGSGLAEIEADLNRADKMQDAALRSAPDSSASVITWLGYDAPDSVPDAIEQKYAHGAKESLGDFQEGLRAAHVGEPSHNTLLGHSYGFVTAAVTAREGGLPVDELVSVAGPGATVDHASQLNLPPEHVWATVADKDPVNDQPFHGEDPADAEFGGRVFDSSPAQSPWPLSIDSHSEYWSEGNKALRNMGHIIAGNHTRVTTG